MTITSEQEFFSMLHATNLAWKIEPDGRIRADGICPVCAVANLRLGRKWFRDDDLAASRYLGLPLHFAMKVSNAADNIGPRPMRRKLLETLRL